MFHTPNMGHQVSAKKVREKLVTRSLNMGQSLFTKWTKKVK